VTERKNRPKPHRPVAVRPARKKTAEDEKRDATLVGEAVKLADKVHANA
jgi:hypothetical protein